MGRRVILLKQEAIQALFAPRGRDAAAVIRVAGVNVPEDAKTIGVGFLPQLKAFAIILDSAKWSQFTAVPANQLINGVQLLEDSEKAIHLWIIDKPAWVCPACEIPGYDEHFSAGVGEPHGGPRLAETAEGGEVQG